MRRNGSRFFLFILVLLGAPGAVFAQTNFGLELGIGPNFGLTPYIDNVVILDDDIPLLVDEQPGGGVNFALRFLFDDLEIGAKIHLYDRTTVITHHRGTDPIPPNRVRPDGSVDDAGVIYEPVERRSSTVPSRGRGDLMMVGMSGGWRWYFLNRAGVSMYIPVVGTVVGVTVLEANNPWVIGLSAGSGLGVSYQLGEPVAIFASAQVDGVVTPGYRSLSDSARTGFTAGESTEEALFASFFQSNVLVGIRVVLR